MRKINILLVMLIMTCFVGEMKAQVHTTQEDESLWGFWCLESIGQLKFENGRISNVQKEALEAMLKATEASIKDIFTGIHFFNDYTVGVCSLKRTTEYEREESEFLPLTINSKGLYLPDQNHLNIKIQDEGEEFGFIYKVDNNILEIIFRNAGNDDRDGLKLVYLKNK